MNQKNSHFAKVDYNSLNAKQKEVHNFHHIAAVLARHGYASYPIRDDWNGGDMIARHMTDVSREMLTIQIKGRLTFDRKYRGKNLWIGFPAQTKEATGDGGVYIFPHDEIMARYEEIRSVKGLQPLEQTGSWQKDGQYSWDSPTKDLMVILKPYRLSASEPVAHQAANDVHDEQGRLQRLAAFAPLLRNRPSEGTAGLLGDGTTRAPFRPASSGTADIEIQFSEMIYSAGWILINFDWSGWMQNGGDRYCKNPGLLATATEEDLEKLLTALVRQDRFSEGTLQDAITSNLILAVAERARTLLAGAG